MHIAAVEQRIRTATSVERVEDADALQLLLGATRPQMPAKQTAFVVPLGLRGGAVRSANAPFIQDTEERVGVILFHRVQRPTGGAMAGDLSATISEIIAAVAGWQPQGAPDTFRLVNGSILKVQEGVLVYQIEFAATAQLRILP